jgi:hypothetical protein
MVKEIISYIESSGLDRSLNDFKKDIYSLEKILIDLRRMDISKDRNWTSLTDFEEYEKSLQPKEYYINNIQGSIQDKIAELIVHSFILSYRLNLDLDWHLTLYLSHKFKKN